MLDRIRRWFTASATPPGPELTPEEEELARAQTHDDYGSLGWRPDDEGDGETENNES